MTYTLKDIKHLEVMANLLNAEPAAPQKIDIKSLLASDEKKELTAGEKILSLCAKLRSEGFDKQASSLEQKFLTYKVATTHLYRAIDEDGEDLINAAHPDGEHKVEDAQDGHGTVDTIVTRHKKIVDKVNKMPTGKLGQYTDRVRDALSKSSQIVDPATAMGFGVYKLWQGFKQFFGDLQDQGEILIKNLESLISNENAQKHQKLLNQMNGILPAINQAISIGPKLEALQVQPEGKLKTIKNYKNSFENLQKAITNLITTVAVAQNVSEGSATSKVYHAFVNSDFQNAKVSLSEFNKTITKILMSLNTLDSNQEKTNNTVNLNFDDAGESPDYKKQSEISKVNSWKATLKDKEMDADRKQHINAWLDNQIKELQAASTPDQIEKIIQENTKFEAKGII